MSVVNYVDTDEQVAMYHDSIVGTVLTQEGLSNDVKRSLAMYRKNLDLNIIDKFNEIEIWCGLTLAWAIYWNRESVQDAANTRKLIVNGCDITVDSIFQQTSFQPDDGSEMLIPEDAEEFSIENWVTRKIPEGKRLPPLDKKLAFKFAIAGKVR